MGRIARNDILYDGCYAHVFSRSFEERKIFESGNDFKYFKESKTVPGTKQGQVGML